jgi:putative inorganic carbon (HCO3(-)) transporter
MMRFGLRLAALEPWLLGTAVILSILSEGLLPFAAGVGLLFWLVRWGATGRPSLASPLNLPALGLVLAGLVSLLATPLPGASLPQALRLTCSLLLCFCLLNWVTSPGRITGLLGGLLALALVLAGGAVLFVDWANKFSFLPVILPNVTTLVFSESINPNVMGGSLVLLESGLAAILVFRWSGLGRLGRAGLGAALLAIAGVMVLAQSRTALVALAAALGLLVLLRFKHGWAMVGLGLCLAAALVLQAGPQQVWDSLGGVTGGTETFTRREQIWNRAKLVIQDFPLTGIGMGTFSQVVDTVYPLSASPVHIPHAHNLFLQIAVDLGLPGLAAWLACWFTVIFMAWQLYRSGPKGGLVNGLGAAVLCSQCALGVNGLLDAVTWDTRPAVIVWVIWGLTAAAWRINRKWNSLPERTRSKIAGKVGAL